MNKSSNKLICFGMLIPLPVHKNHGHFTNNLADNNFSQPKVQIGVSLVVSSGFEWF